MSVFRHSLRLLIPRLSSLPTDRILSLNPPLVSSSILHCNKSTKKITRSNEKKPMSFGDILDELDDDDEEEQASSISEAVQRQNIFLDTEAAKFIYHYHSASKKSLSKSKGHRGKHHSAHQGVADYYDVNSIIDVEEYWSELNKTMNDLRQYFAHHLTIRSANALDDLPINFDGDTYPLHELATISKKDAKRLIIDCCSFPSVLSSVSRAISDSNMNLSPQIDGNTVIVPIPKITREYREQLAKGAKNNFLKSKDEFRKIQNKYISTCQNQFLIPECKLPKDKHHIVEDIIRAIAHEFVHQSEELLKIKQKEILGK